MIVSIVMKCFDKEVAKEDCEYSLYLSNLHDRKWVLVL